MKQIKYSYDVIEASTGKVRIKEDIGHSTREEARLSQREWARFGIKTKILQHTYENVTTKTVR